MSTTTTNYNLIKPELTDAADITATNANWDTIDSNLNKATTFVPTEITASSDLNTYTTSGIYKCSTDANASTITNSPTDLAFSLLVETHSGVKQTVTDRDTASPKVYVRNKNGDTWGSWARVYSTLDKPTLTELGITATAAELNVLDGITATTTELNYVDGVTSAIQTQINGKANSSHTHSATDITSGTLPITRGGTGGATQSGSNYNLTFYGMNSTPSEDLPAYYPVGMAYYMLTPDSTLPYKLSSYGILVSVKTGSELSQLWFTQPHGTVYRRGGNSVGWNGSATVPTNRGWVALNSNVATASVE